MSALIHFGRAVCGVRFGPKKGLCLLTCYLDEGGEKQDRFTVVCGLISTGALWEQFEIDSKLLLASYKVPSFHMMEFAHSTGPSKSGRTARLSVRTF